MPDRPRSDPVSPNTATRLIRAAREGDSNALGRLFDASRPYLLTVVRERFDMAISGKLSPNDVIQDTFMDVRRDFPAFTSDTYDALKRWLRKLLLHNLEDSRRRFMETEKRDVSREAPIHFLTPRYPRGKPVYDQNLSPLSRMIQEELESRLQDAISTLPDRDQQILYLRYQLDLPLAIICDKLGLNYSAARMRYERAIEKLNLRLRDTPT